jgi:hypothetical protein
MTTYESTLENSTVTSSAGLAGIDLVGFILAFIMTLGPLAATALLSH